MNHRIATLGLIGLLSVLLLTTQRTSYSSGLRTEVHPVEQPVRLAHGYGSLPMNFKPNKGQFDRQFKFGTESNGYALFLSPSSATLKFPNSADNKPATVVMKFRGANEDASIRGGKLLPGVANYFRGTSEHWITNVPTFERVLVKDMYPGIDAAYYGNQSRLEYDLIVSPGASPKQIDIDFEGATNVELTNDGDLVISVADEQIRQPKPDIYQEDSAGRTYVQGKYTLRGRNRVGFQIAEFDRNKPLVIDPQLVYSIFGQQHSLPKAIAVDSTGSALIAGITMDPFINNQTDAFVAKINAAGTDFLWVNSFGAGRVQDRPSAIAVDMSGNVYVTGFTGGGIAAAPPEQWFPTINPIQPIQFNIGAFVTKFNSAGSMVYSTMLGGSDLDNGNGIAVDSLGNMYVAGETRSADFPLSKPFQSTLRGDSDAFVSVLNPTGSAFIFSTYVGGAASESATGIAADAYGNSYVTGSTTSADFPTSYPIQTAAGNSDGFVFKLNPAGSAFQYSTYLGGNGPDQGNGIAVDSDGNAYIAGTTDSTNFPVVSPLQSTLRGMRDAFLTKINSAGSAFSYSTYIGGGNSDEGIAVTVNRSGNAFIAGATFSFDFPAVRSLEAFTGTQDAFVAELSPAGSTSVYATLMGGAQPTFSTTLPAAMTIDKDGGIYVVGATTTPDFHVTSNPARFDFLAPTRGEFVGNAPFISKLIDDPTITPWTRVEENNAAIQYSGDWLSDKDAGHSGGTAKLTLVNSVTFSFSGTGARWIGFSDPWSGLANVYVDGVFKASVDTYSAATRFRVLQYEITGLPAGNHTLKIQAIGQHNAAAASAWVWVDSFEFTSIDGSGGIPDFSVSIAPTSSTIVQGGTATFTVTVSPMNGFSGNVSLSAGGLGTFGTMTLSPSSIQGAGTSMLTVTTNSNISPATYGVTVVGTNGSLSRSALADLKVNPLGGTIVWTRVDQDSAAVQYSGDWASNTNSNHSGGRAKLTLANSATFGFSGTGARWIGFRDPWSGIANVYVDGVFKSAVDTYSSSTQYQQVLYAITGLAPGQHTLRIQATAQRSSAALSAWVWADAFESTSSGTGGTPDFAISASPTSAAVVQGGSTTFAISVGALNGFAGTVSLSAAGFGSGVSGSFNPPSITASSSSTLTVTTTGTTQTGTSAITITGSSGSLTHTAPVTLNVKSPGVITWTRVDQNNPSAQFNGDWITNTNPGHSGGSAKLTLGSSVTLNFSGTGVRWIGFSDPWSGIANVYVDGVLKTSVDTYSTMTRYQVVQYAITGLAPGNHTLKIVATGQRNPAASSAWVWVDAFESTN